MLQMLFCSNLAQKFSCFDTQLVCDGPTDQPTDQRMDKPSYRDARLHLEIRQGRKI